MKPQPRSRKAVAAGRIAILQAAMRGPLTHEQACVIGGFAQCWYHLETMRKKGLLKRLEFNTWRATPRAKVLVSALGACPPTTRTCAGA
jgi:peptidoglycan biosynthesis protein MviN/MurJ (putative lipid II flippase)